MDQAALEAAALWVTVVGFPLTFFGVIFSGVQAYRSRTAAVAARNAASRATGRVVELRLQAQVGHMLLLVGHLEHAQQTGNRPMATMILGLWESAAADVIGSIKETDLDTGELRPLIGASRTEGHVARHRLAGTEESVTQATMAMRKTMGDVMAAAGELASGQLGTTDQPRIGVGP